MWHCHIYVLSLWYNHIPIILKPLSELGILFDLFILNSLFGCIAIKSMSYVHKDKINRIDFKTFRKYLGRKMIDTLMGYLEQTEVNKK